MVSINATNGGRGVAFSNPPGEVNFYHNSIYLYGNDSNSKVVSFDNNSEGVGNVDFRNNILANLAEGYVLHGVFSDGAEGLSSSGYNDLYTTGNAVALWEKSTAADLGEWQRLTGFDRHSPVGAYKADPLADDRAFFGFNARHKKGAEAPEGNVAFILRDARLVFRSSRIDWLAVEEDQAFIKGSGSIGREDGYQFLISVVDHGQGIHRQNDHFRMIIWDQEGNIIYDNQPGDLRYAEASMPIQRGYIIIQGSKGKSNFVFSRKQEEPMSGELRQAFRAYPTKLSQTGLWLEFPAMKGDEKLQLTIYDLQGRKMATKFFKPREQEEKQLWKLEHQDWRPGIYLLMIKGNQLNYQQKLIK